MAKLRIHDPGSYAPAWEITGDHGGPQPNYGLWSRTCIVHSGFGDYRRPWETKAKLRIREPDFYIPAWEITGDHGGEDNGHTTDSGLGLVRYMALETMADHGRPRASWETTANGRSRETIEREPKPLAFLCTTAGMHGSGVSFELPPPIVCIVLVENDNYTLSFTAICGDALEQDRQQARTFHKAKLKSKKWLGESNVATFPVLAAPRARPPRASRMAI